ncbi:large conductance mechanosensitive channel protein MscL [Rickettsiales bacterium LUAb2]
MFQGFKNFLLKGKSIELAVGVIIGASFSNIVNSLVNNVIMPPVGLLLGRVDFSNFFIVIKQGKTASHYSSLLEASKDGAITIDIGSVINNIVSFILVGFCIYVVVILINKLETISPLNLPADKKDVKNCKFCCSEIAVKATRCPNCTSELVKED